MSFQRVDAPSIGYDCIRGPRTSIQDHIRRRKYLIISVLSLVVLIIVVTVCMLSVFTRIDVPTPSKVTTRRVSQTRPLILPDKNITVESDLCDDVCEYETCHLLGGMLVGRCSLYTPDTLWTSSQSKSGYMANSQTVSKKTCLSECVYSLSTRRFNCTVDLDTGDTDECVPPQLYAETIKTMGDRPPASGITIPPAGRTKTVWMASRSRNNACRPLTLNTS
ncbi:24.4 kDa [Spodoptera frugiperda ascovirus 1a]|uniref:24.4 kDa n=1 Tax=Spodoptera frugiperda ascovirus 1a TaxID=113370 RepID=Q0E594_SFAVA|nr:24.4 kDa [Spodoptera frugiperda ascovirus 1a]CAL44607.1 24.4 kDa [Spodoptera frugiperda ascovirus 1a]